MVLTAMQDLIPRVQRNRAPRADSATAVTKCRRCSHRPSEQLLGAQQADHGFTVAYGAAERPVTRLGERQPVHLDDLGTLGSAAARGGAGGEEQVQPLAEHPGGAEHGAEAVPVNRADARLLAELAARGGERRLAGLELAGRQLPQPAVRHVAVLAQQAYA